MGYQILVMNVAISFNIEAMLAKFFHVWKESIIDSAELLSLSHSETGLKIGIFSCEWVTARNAEGQSGYTILDLLRFEYPETILRQK